jgi:hypothetical protein
MKRVIIIFLLGQTQAFMPSRTDILSRRNAWMTKTLESTTVEYNIDTETNTPIFNVKTSLPESTYTQVMASLDLQPIATKLRERYDDHFKDPRQPDSKGERFCWDPWFVKVGDGLQNQHSYKNEDENKDEDDENLVDTQLILDGEEEAVNKQTQYSLKRIQSNNFFNEDDFGDLVQDLTQLGRSIGLTAITPPWISLYTQGDMQNLHTDAPHGPCAFVLSLCNEGDFEGGETILLKPQILELWRGFDGSKGLETGGIMRYIPPSPLGKCIVFDPRVPHGVSQVMGTNDPRKGRVVIHGWFNQPEVCWFGPWNDEDTVGRMNAMLDEALQPLVETIGSGDIGRVVGYLACRVEIDADGYVEDVFGVCDTLQADNNDFRGVIGYDESDRPVMEDAVSDVKLTVYENLKNLHFEDGENGRSVVVPFAFE